MGAVGRQVILNRLVIAYVDEYVVENADMRVFVNSRQHSALGHVLHNSHSFQAYRFSTGIRAGNNQYA